MYDTSKVWENIQAKGNKNPETGKPIFKSKGDLDEFLKDADQLRNAMINRGTIIVKP